MTNIGPIATSIICAILLTLCSAASAEGLYSGEELADQNGCMSYCHKAAQASIGPTFKDVARKYKGDAEAAVKLTSSIKNGSRGVWGGEAMLPRTKVSDQEIAKIVAWILSLT